ncbi:peroxide stress protein YaaA, partial [Xanthovirga aplysinae]|uniref:peroxide stress protein YaaA n=1 Tax=Xanthovirga aplysinae TaxID=2529853 RepID=UPI0012BD1BF9
STPELLEESKILVKELKGKSEAEIAQLMNLSEKLATLNFERFQEFHFPFSIENAKQALLAFKGDVYTGFDLDNYSEEDFHFAQDHIRILSGLYGLLKPMDLIQPYRLEMKTPLTNPRGKDLYKFWGNRITNLLNQQLEEQKEKILVNLASNEYFKAIDTKSINGRIITPIFKENKNGHYKVIGLFAKKARGAMADYIIKNQMEEVEYLKAFTEGGYIFNEELSKTNEWVFTRG